MLKSLLNIKKGSLLYSERISSFAIHQFKAIILSQRLVGQGVNKFEKRTETPINASTSLSDNRRSSEGQTNAMLRAESKCFNTDEEKRHLKVLQLEADIACQEGLRVPPLQAIRDQDWKYIMTLTTKSARMKYYAYLWKIQMKKEAQLRKKQQKAAYAAERIQEVRKSRAENNHIVYGLGHVTMFLRVYDTTVNQWMNHRLIRAMQFSPKIVYDCSYDDKMTKREAENAAKQLMLSFAENRNHDDPFDLHFCNVNLNSICMQSLRRYIPTMLNPEFPLNVHNKCFTELFPKQNLVYLTPHCRTDLQSYNPDDIYIIGTMVDTVNNEPLSLAKAKRMNLRMARLPLDHYLQWGSGSGKTLTLNQVLSILLDLKKSNDWSTALRHVPRRKIVDVQEERIVKFRKAFAK